MRYATPILFAIGMSVAVIGYKSIARKTFEKLVEDWEQKNEEFFR